MVDAGRLFTLAWRILPRVPGPIVRGVFDLAGILAHRFRMGGVAQLERNLARVTGLQAAQLREVSKEGMRRYMRYYAEVFQLPRMDRDQVAARVRTVNAAPTREALRSGSVVAALGHLGNWDLAGAWSARNFAHIVTVAEKLQPPELFDQFLTFREDLGMDIFAFEKGTGLFGELVAAAGRGNSLMPLLADRDLSKDGMVVRVRGHQMRVAPGPALVSLHGGVPFVGAFIRHERLRGARRKAAGSPWGIVIEFTNIIEPPADGGSGVAQEMMQTWADEFSAFLADHAQDWHMLQKCFMADLDATRLVSAGEGVYGGDA